MSGKFVTATLYACAALSAPPSLAEVAVDEHGAELQALRQRVQALEERIASEAPTSNTDAPDTTARIGHISLSGDTRYRAESIDAGHIDLDRQRVRARFGVEARVSDSLKTAFRLSTGEGDPRSAHLTFSGGYSRRSVGVDLAYVQYSVLPELRVAAGKVPYPNWQPGQSALVGGDFNPEGWSISYRSVPGWFATSHHFWLQTRADAEDSRQSGLQFGYASAADAPMRFTLAVAYTDFTHVKGEKPFLDGINPFGNSLNPAGELLHDFNIAELSSEVTIERYPGSLTLFTHVAKNVAVPENDIAYAAGVAVGAARLKHWRVGYQYAHIEKDALFGQLMDGDFAGGNTDSRGHVLRLAYRSESRWSSTLSYMHNRVNIASTVPGPFTLIQLDIDFVF